jgi:hypothetical protein
MTNLSSFIAIGDMVPVIYIKMGKRGRDELTGLLWTELTG